MIVDPPDRLPAVPPHHRRRLSAISLLPATATLGNMFCGFMAIFCCLLSMRAEFGKDSPIQPRMFHPLEPLFPTHIAAGVYLIVAALVFDALDGRLARITRRTSEFGAQLDSLSDIVSFGIAPMALFLTMLLRPEAGSLDPAQDASRLEFRVGLTCATVYLVCAAIRLARYNVENIKSDQATRAFSGLPSPGAAAAIASLVALHENLRTGGVSGWGVDWANVARWVIAAACFGCGLLMVSRLDYVHVFNVYARRRHPPTHLIWLIAIVGLAVYSLERWYSFELLFVVVAWGYVISGLVANLRRRGRAPAGAAAPPPPLHVGHN